MRNLPGIAVALLVFIAACTKIESTTIGTGLIPPIDGVNTFDTVLDVVTGSFINPGADSLRVLRSDDHVIGTISNDPLFGKTTATTYFQLEPTFYKYFFQGNKLTYNVDSAVLIMSYRGAFGDTSAAAIPQTWEVRELTETLRYDTTYDVRKSFATGALLGTATINPSRLKDSVKYGFENARNQIRIRLSQAFANRLIKTYDSLPGNAYASDSLFKENFKGFAVGPATGSSGNTIIRINLLDTNTKLALFYNYKAHPDSVRRDTTVNYFRFRSSIDAYSAHANYIKREYSGSQFAQFNNTGNNDSLVFVQTAPGTMTKIRIPGLRNLPNVIVHRAELITRQVPDPLATVYDIPGFLLLSTWDSLNKQKSNVPNDFYISGGNLNIPDFGGYSADRDVPGVGIVQEYMFDLSRYVQGIVTRKDTSYTLLLSAPVNDSIQYYAPYPLNTLGVRYYLSAATTNQPVNGRVRLGGGGMSAANPLRMRLRIIYSKI